MVFILRIKIIKSYSDQEWEIWDKKVIHKVVFIEKDKSNLPVISAWASSDAAWTANSTTKNADNLKHYHTMENLPALD